MIASYRENPVYENNPFIEALPLPLMNAELYQVLKRQPTINNHIKQLSASERLSCLSKIYEMYIPPDYAPTIYQMIYQGVLSSYATKFNIDTIRQSGRIKEAMDHLSIPNTSTYATQALSGSILGVSGIGKTSTILRILELFPQVIEHEQYKGEPFFCKQITYLNIQCPNDCSVKAACLYILSAIDQALGTTYSFNAMSRKSLTVDAMIAQISQLCITHHVGIIVIDEIQNILATNKKGETNHKLIKFLVQLMNDTGVSIILVGTPEVGVFFDQQPHLSRRTRGPRIYPLKYSTEFHNLVSEFWKMQCLKYSEPLTDDLEEILFSISGGVPALLAQTIYYAQQYAINSGIERLTIRVIQETTNLYQLRKPFPFKQDNLCSVSFPNKKGSSIPLSDTKKRGRPKVLREQEDLLMKYESAEGKQELLQWMKERGFIWETEKC